jgi:hypothetical protein
MRIRTLVPCIAVALTVSACAPAQSAPRSSGALSERQKAKRFTRIVSAFNSEHLFVEEDAMRHYVARQSEACDLSPPKSEFDYEYLLQEGVAELLTDVKLVQPYDDMHARFAALHPRTSVLRTLVSSSGIQVREGSKLSSLADPDYCSLVHAWKDQQWSHSFPTAYFYGVMRDRGVNVRLIRQQRHRAGDGFSPSEARAQPPHRD